MKKKLQSELSQAYPARFPAAPRDLFAERQRELLLLECDALASEEDGKHAMAMADIRRVLVQMMVPPALRSGDPNNAVLALERTFENQVAELETHCNVSDPGAMTVFSFLHRVGYFEKLMAREHA